MYSRYLAVSAQEKNVLDRILKKKRANDVLQIGGFGDTSIMMDMPFVRKFFLDVDRHAQGATPFIQGNAECLPIQSEAMDIILMMHQLEFTRNPMDSLQEAYRVLRPNGQLIVLGFNRWSAWNLCHERKKYCSMRKIKRCLFALGFEMLLERTFCFWSQSTLLETLGQFILPNAGSVYLFVVQKNIRGMTPLVVSNYRRAPI